MAPRQKIKKNKDSGESKKRFQLQLWALFRMADKFVSKCDAEVAIITFCNDGNICAFGHPSVDSVVQRYKAKKSLSSSSRNEGNVDDDEQSLPENGTEETPDDQSKTDQMDLALPSWDLMFQEPGQNLPENETEESPDDVKEAIRSSLERNGNDENLLEDVRDGNPVGNKPEIAVWDLELHELEQLEAQMEEMKKKVVDRANQLRSSAV